VAGQKDFSPDCPARVFFSRNPCISNRTFIVAAVPLMSLAFIKADRLAVASLLPAPEPEGASMA
jgi:hypothetical protein